MTCDFSVTMSRTMLMPHRAPNHVHNSSHSQSFKTNSKSPEADPGAGTLPEATHSPKYFVPHQNCSPLLDKFSTAVHPREQVPL